MYRAHRLVFCLVLALAAVGCGDQSEKFFEQSGLLDKPVALDQTLVFVDSSRNLAFLLDAGEKEPSAEAKRVKLPFGAMRAERRNGKKDEALVLCSGRRSSRQAGAEPAVLAAVTANGTLRGYELGTTPFDTLVQSDDGRYAVLFRSGESDDRVLNNANELAIVDLDAKPSKSAVMHKTPTSFGHTPTGAVFSPEIDIDGESRRLLVVLSQAEVTLIDLAHLDRRETIVQIGGADARAVDPKQVLFGADGEPTLYVRGDGSNDIFVFRLEARDADATQNDFRPSINQLGGGTGPRDMALYEGTQGTRLLVVAQSSSQAIVVDPSSSKATSIQLPARANHILLFEGTSPKDDTVKTRALLYADASNAVMFLDLEGVEERRGRNLELLTLDKTITTAIPLREENKLVLLQEGNGVSLLDLAQRSVLPIASNVELRDALFDGEHKKLWVAPLAQERIATLDLTSGTTDEIPLDANVQLMVPLFTIGKLAIVHASKVGYVTFVDTKSPQRENARSVRGFLLADVLDRGAP